jgi:regulator of replication initiation timing
LSSDVVFPVDAFAKEQLIARKWVPSVDIIAKDNANLTEKVREQEKQIADLTRQNECLAANYKAALERKTHVATTISEENEKLRERIRELKNDKPRSEVTVEELSSFVVSMRGTPDGFAVALLNMISEGHIVLVKQSS